MVGPNALEIDAIRKKEEIPRPDRLRLALRLVNVDPHLAAIDVQIVDLPPAKEDAERIELTGNALRIETGNGFPSIARLETLALGGEQSGSPDGRKLTTREM